MAVEVRDAATVAIVRDDPELHVFMLRRNPRSEFVGGVYVFPGGAVDEADRHAELESICDGRSDDEASAVTGVDRGGLAYWVAAVRECFEEAGLLLARSNTGPGNGMVSFADPATAERFAHHRDAVNSGDLRLVELCRLEGLRLVVDDIHYFSHWITPEGPPRRYDTRFFLVAAPEEQEPLHDDKETVANIWVRPGDALARHKSGELDLILPTIKILEGLSAYDRSSELLAATAAGRFSVAQVPMGKPGR